MQTAHPSISLNVAMLFNRFPNDFISNIYIISQNLKSNVWYAVENKTAACKYMDNI